MNRVPAIVRAIRLDAGLSTPEDAAKALGWNPAGAWGAYVRVVEDGGRPSEPWGYPYVVRGVIGLWMLRRGGWRVLPAGGGYLRAEDGANINGNGTSSWCSWPRSTGRATLHERMGDGDIEGPVMRRDILRLMIQATPALAGVVGGDEVFLGSIRLSAP